MVERKQDSRGNAEDYYAEGVLCTSNLGEATENAGVNDAANIRDEPARMSTFRLISKLLSSQDKS